MAHFICLANSKKYSKRCIAGIALSPNKSGYAIVKNEHKPVWVRPISDCEHGEVDSDLVKNIRLLDIVEIEITEQCPQGFQSENVFFTPDSIQISRGIKVYPNILDKLLSVGEEDLFGNAENKVSELDAQRLGHSLSFIKPRELELYIKSIAWGKKQMRGKFSYNQVVYDLPVTDVSFLDKYQADLAGFKYAENTYLTISLGTLFNGDHYKLIAGVVVCE